jgi:hypothetical protein
MGIEALAFESDKQVARLQGATVGVNAMHHGGCIANGVCLGQPLLCLAQREA